MNRTLQAMLGVAGVVVATQAVGQVTFYEDQGFRGRSFTADRTVRNLENQGFNDAASSAVVRAGTWEVCEDARFEGRCVLLQPGEYPNLRDAGINNRISSVRPADERTAYNEPRRAYNDDPRDSHYRRRGDERVFEVPVTSVRAVVGPPEQRCWVEREQYVDRGGSGGGPNVPGAVIGGVLGGILGHQIGSGRGNDVATVAGAVGGATLGAGVGTDRYGAPVTSTRDVQRCANVQTNSRPDYWDVTYNFDGREHHVQMANPPGRTLLVNRDGEPRE